MVKVPSGINGASTGDGVTPTDKKHAWVEGDVERYPFLAGEDEMLLPDDQFEVKNQMTFEIRSLVNQPLEAMFFGFIVT